MHSAEAGGGDATAGAAGLSKCIAEWLESEQTQCLGSLLGLSCHPPPPRQPSLVSRATHASHHVTAVRAGCSIQLPSYLHVVRDISRLLTSIAQALSSHRCKVTAGCGDRGPRLFLLATALVLGENTHARDTTPETPQQWHRLVGRCRYMPGRASSVLPWAGTERVSPPTT